MGSIQINRRFSSWERFINNSLITSAGAQKFPLTWPVTVLYVSYVADAVCRRPRDGRETGRRSTASLAGPHGWELQAPGLYLLKDYVRTALWLGILYLPSLSFLIQGMRYPPGVASRLHGGWFVWLYLGDARTFDFRNKRSWRKMLGLELVMMSWCVNRGFLQIRWLYIQKSRCDLKSWRSDNQAKILSLKYLGNDSKFCFRAWTSVLKPSGCHDVY